MITLVFQITASLLQPLIGYAADRRPVNVVLPIGMGFTLVGLALLAFARSYELILVSVAVIGIGSAVFHPEASRVARAASGGRYGFAQSFFQVGGNFGQSTRAAAGGLCRRAVRPALGPGVHGPGADRGHPAHRRQPLVRRASDATPTR